MRTFSSQVGVIGRSMSSSATKRDIGNAGVGLIVAAEICLYVYPMKGKSHDEYTNVGRSMTGFGRIEAYKLER